MFCSGSNLQIITEVINTELNKLKAWLDKNKKIIKPEQNKTDTFWQTQN